MGYHQKMKELDDLEEGCRDAFKNVSARNNNSFFDLMFMRFLAWTVRACLSAKEDLKNDI